MRDFPPINSTCSRGGRRSRRSSPAPRPRLDVALIEDRWSKVSPAPPMVTVESLPLSAANVGAVSLPIVSPQDQSGQLPVPASRLVARKSTRRPAKQRRPRPTSTVQALAARHTTRTRIQPPGDVIKLEDRLFYLLQPSLESLIGEASLSMPGRPFPYQFEGIAFLYPRYAAVLADEMGLGKTMQAITAIRLLLHAGELRSVLLVCPKPLVTNWQREFAQWADELPVTVIEGDQTRRRWQWQQTETPVKIANYELLQRDRESGRRARPAVRPGRARRSPAHQEPHQRHQPGGARTVAPPQLGARPARPWKTARRTWWASSSSWRPAICTTA